MPVKVLLVDDHEIIRTSLRRLLEQQSDIDVVGEAANGGDAVNLANKLAPDVVLMDVKLRQSEITGLEATKKITEANAHIRVIALSVEEDLNYIKGMLSNGAVGYLYKDCSEDELVEAIHSVRTGKMHFSKEAREKMDQDYQKSLKNPAQNREEKLTNRERQILKCIALGQTSKGIAGDLDISRKTVDAHKRNIMEKLNLWSIAELTRYALREELISNDDF